MSNTGCSIFSRSRGGGALDALTKEDEIPRADIARAVKRMNLLKMNPNAHTYESQD